MQIGELDIDQPDPEQRLRTVEHQGREHSGKVYYNRVCVGILLLFALTIMALVTFLAVRHSRVVDAHNMLCTYVAELLDTTQRANFRCRV